MLQTIGAFQAKTHFSSLLQQVEEGAHIIITKHGNPVAKLVPIIDRDHQEIKNTIQKLQKFANNHQLGGLDWRALRDEGRR